VWACGDNVHGGQRERRIKFRGTIIVLCCGAGWIYVQHLGYVEFGVV